MYIAHGKKGSQEFHSVKEHSLEVAQIAGDLGKQIGLQHTCYLAGLLHDMGKYSNAFQEYIRRAIEGDGYNPRGSVNHASAGAHYIHANFYKESPVEMLAAQIIAYAIWSHHGLRDIIAPNDNFAYEKSVIKYGDAQEAIDAFIEEFKDDIDISKYFNEANNEIRKFISKTNSVQYPKKDGVSQNFSIAMLTRFVLSTIVDGDWESTYQYMEDKPEKEISIDPNFWEIMISRFEEYSSKFTDQKEINRWRKQISNECAEFAKHKPGIYRLPCATGSGKTLASFRFGLYHAKLYDKKRIIYVAPYMSILEQNAEVIREIIKDEALVLEHHSNIIPNDSEKYQYLTGRWNSPVILTTMVQFLNTLFSDKNQSIRRFQSFADSVIILDEVQSLPVKCIYMFNLAMNFLANICGATVILCSATQPVLDKVEYPVLLNEPGNMIKDVDTHFEQFRRVAFDTTGIYKNYTNEYAGEFLFDRSREFQSVLMIANTKASAKKIFDLVEIRNKSSGETTCLFYIDANMCPEHRSDVLTIIREKLKTERVICVSTPVIEAGVDVSFDCVIRSLAGLDSIAQAAGRCNREGNEQKGKVYIIKLSEENLENLVDIKAGQEATIAVCDELTSNNEHLTSAKAMDLYYNKYYFSRQHHMPYRLSQDSILELLSNNINKRAAYRKKTGKVDYMLYQSFKTAGESFEVIDSNTVGVIVPYGKGKDLIADLGECKREKELRDLLKRAQRYTVNIYENKLSELMSDGAIVTVGDGLAYVLKEGFYDDVTGLRFQNSKKLSLYDF